MSQKRIKDKWSVWLKLSDLSTQITTFLSLLIIVELLFIAFNQTSSEISQAIRKGWTTAELKEMMLSYNQVQKKLRVLQSLTGLNMSEFEKLLVRFEQAWQDYLNQHYIHASRARRYDGGNCQNWILDLTEAPT